METKDHTKAHGSFGVRFFFLTVFLPLGMATFANLISQRLAGRMDAPHFVGLLGLVPMRDDGMLWGLLAHVPEAVGGAVFAATTAFLLLLYGMIQFSLPGRSPLARVGLSIVAGAILGDEIAHSMTGCIVRFLCFGTEHFHTQPLNVGDGGLILGIAALIASPWIGSLPFTYQRAVRSSLWVNLRVQLKYCGVLVTVGSAFAAIICSFGYFYLRSALLATGTSPGHGEILDSYATIAIFLSVCFVATLFFMGVVQSHRVVGPLFAFERFLADLLEGRRKDLHLRDGDEFRHLEELATELAQRWEAKGAAKVSPPPPPRGKGDYLAAS